MKKLVILHNECKEFRNPLFIALQERFECHFYFLRSNEEGQKGLSNVNIGTYFRVPKMQDLEIPTNLFKYLREINPDVIVSTDLGYAITYVGFIYSIIYKKKFILWNEQWSEILHPRRYFTRILENYICRNSHGFLAFGEKHKHFLIKRGAKSNMISVVPNAIPNGYISTSIFQSNYFDFKKSDFNVLVLARLVSFKGHEQLIMAAPHLIKKIKNIKFIFAGEGPCYSSLKNKIKQLGVDDYFYIPNKKYNNQDKNYLISNADLVCLPSTRSRTTEAWGLVINEVVSQNIPILVSSCTGVAGELIINNETGLIFKDKNIADLCEKIIFSSENRSQCIEMATKCNNLLKDKYSMELLIQETISTIDGVLS